MICKSAILTVTFTMLALVPLCGAQDHSPPNLDSAIAQDHAPPNLDSAIEVIRAKMQADRASIITEAMNFSDKDAAAFWPIYRKYVHERSMLDDERVAVIKEYAEKYGSLSDADAKSMAERMFECDSRLAALKKKYFKQFNAVLAALTVTKFFQLEHRIDLLMDFKVESSLPPLTDLQRSEQQN